MGYRINSVFTTTLVNTAIGGGETIVLTTPPLTLPIDNTQVELVWWVQLATGAGGTVITWTLRRGATVAGASIITGALTSVATTNIFLPQCWVDNPGAVAGVQYSFTLADNGAAGVAAFGALLAMAL